MAQASEDTEIVDIVDENDNVLYPISRQEAHQKGLLHRTVIANIIDNAGKIVLVEQSPSRQDAGQYVFPIGGDVRSDETIDDALKREALEEAGLTSFEYKVKGKFIYNRFVLNRQENHLFIVYEVHHDHNIKTNEESVSHKSFTKDELKKEITINKNRFGAPFFAILEHIYPELLDK